MITASTFSLSAEKDVADMVRGLTLLGTGGGGRPDVGRRALSDVLASGKKVRLLALSELPDDATVCALSGVGSIAPTDVWRTAKRIERGYPEQPVAEWPMVSALQALMEYARQKVDAIFPMELGPGNSTTPIAAAAWLGIDVLDCDCAGRAIPEMTQTTVGRSNIKFTPAVFADPWGNVLILKDVASPKLGERLGKLISIAAKDPDPKVQCARAAYLMKGVEIKRLAVPGGYSRALAVGRAIASAMSNGTSPAIAAASLVAGEVAFSGVLTAKTWQSRDGYMYGDFIIKEQRASREAKIWFKNENHIFWLDGQVRCTSPDLIMLMNSRTGDTYTNTDIPEGIEVAVIVAPAEEKMRTKDAVRSLGPRHFGFDIPFVQAKS